MIRVEEIQEIAGRVGLQTQVVEKDFALGWFLAGIHQHTFLREHWVFKGGTCLKKCYFETYRFSEDLDFTVRNQPTSPNADDFKSIFLEVAQWIHDNSGLEVPADTVEFEVFNNPRGTVSVQGKAGYRGPVRPQMNASRLPKIKIDLTFDEPLILPATVKKVDHPYSDCPTDGIFITAYSYEEVFAEKTRALAQRLRPRDLYDVVHLFRRKDLNPDLSLVRSTLESKCRIRSMDVPTLTTIQTHENRQLLESEWETMLAHQVSTLPPFQQFLDELPDALAWIRGEDQEELPTIETGEEPGATVSTATPASLGLSIGMSNLDKIRFAAANRLRLRLGYEGSYREIEPYSFARSSEGNLLLMAVKSQTGETRSYRFDRLQSIEVTTMPFQPRYTVEITSSGYLPVHQLTRSASLNRVSSRRVTGGPTYVFQCTVCHKQFRRKSNDPSLKPHKRSNGQTCYGSYGRYLRMDYR